mmetsp:Transcript_11886/g.27770  ORF Transcript_11886/g.27770 Transcript_11886/m.27770 type:complete len:202 (+) Transcript_11886:931-1536(+)
MRTDGLPEPHERALFCGPRSVGPGGLRGGPGADLPGGVPVPAIARPVARSRERAAGHRSLCAHVQQRGVQHLVGGVCGERNGVRRLPRRGERRRIQLPAPRSSQLGLFVCSSAFRSPGILHLRDLFQRKGRRSTENRLLPIPLCHRPVVGEKRRGCQRPLLANRLARGHGMRGQSPHPFSRGTVPGSTGQPCRQSTHFPGL